MNLRRHIAGGLALGATVLYCQSGPQTAEPLWTARVEPLFDRHCFKCHGGVRQKSGLDLRSLENILKGGDQGPAVVPGKPEESHLYQFVQPGADPHMPPDEKKQIKPEEIAAVKTWILKLPPVDRVLTAGMTTNSSWAGDYVAGLKKLQKPAWTPPAGMSAAKVIDRFVALGWKEQDVKPSKICDDRAFVRRIYLDLAGRIPTVNETEDFLRARRRDRRERLVDALLASDDYARHMRDVFDVVLLERPAENAENRRRDPVPRRDDRWFQFLEDSFRANRPWNEIVRELIIARPADETRRGAVWYLYERRNNHQAMAEAVAPVAFGMQIKCAQCHNDPLAWEVEQRHYWGLVAAFNRSTNVANVEGIGVAESAIGGFVNFTNLKKESQPAQLDFPNGKSVSEKRPAENEKEKDEADLYRVLSVKEKEKPSRAAVPKFSRRAALAEAVTHDNPALARAFVNRLWALLLGRGLVHPVDQMDSRHRPSHPDLLDWLARDFEQSGYNVKRLIRNVALTRAYQLGARPRGSAPPPPEAFARALDKPLTAEQFYRSFLLAAGHETTDGKVAGHKESEIRQAFVARFPEVFPVEYNPSLQQAMFLSNSPLLDDLLKPQPGNTAARLLELESDERRVQQAFLTVFSRAPDQQELARTKDFLRARKPEAGVRHLLWALLASAEFQVNH